MYMEPLSTELGSMRVRRNIVPVMIAMIATCMRFWVSGMHDVKCWHHASETIDIAACVHLLGHFTQGLAGRLVLVVITGHLP